MARALRILRVAIVLSFYFFLAAPTGYAAFAVYSALPTRDPRRRARRLQSVMKTAFGSMHTALRWFRILDFNPADVEGDIPSEPCVLVSNHPTLVDISAMLATEPHLVFPVKASLFRAFWARPLLQAADQFEASEADPFAIGRVVEDAMERLEQGYRVIMFPEGTRSPPDGLHPFGRMAFEIALRQNVPIVPLVITCEPRWLTRERSFFASVKSVPRLRIRALEPILPGQQGSSSRTLRDIVALRIQSELGLTQPSVIESAQDQDKEGERGSASAQASPSVSSVSTQSSSSRSSSSRSSSTHFRSPSIP